MSYFIELPKGSEKVLVNTDNITIIESHSYKQTKIHFIGGGFLVIDLDYSSTICLLNVGGNKS